MLVETDNLVSADEFRANMDEYITAARRGSGPLALTRDSEVIGFFISADEYESLFGAAVRNLLSSRSRGPTVSHEEAREKVLGSLRRRRKK